MTRQENGSSKTPFKRLRDASILVGLGREGRSLARRLVPAVIRKIPVESLGRETPLIRHIPMLRDEVERIGARERERKEQIARDAVANVQGSLLDAAQERENEFAKDRRQEYLRIFGEDPLHLPEQPKRADPASFRFLGKGWNSFAVAFRVDGRQQVIKVGYPLSPDGQFFSDPSKPEHARELQEDVRDLQEAHAAIRQTRGRTPAQSPDFFPELPVIQQVPFTGSRRGKEMQVTVLVAPFVEMVSSKEQLKSFKQWLAHHSETETYLKQRIQELESMREWLRDKRHKDLDLSGKGNVGLRIVRDAQGEISGYDLCILDTGLRHLDKIALVGHALFDFASVMNWPKLLDSIEQSIDHSFWDKPVAYIEKVVQQSVASIGRRGSEAAFIVQSMHLRGSSRRRVLWEAAKSVLGKGSEQEDDSRKKRSA